MEDMDEDTITRLLAQRVALRNARDYGAADEIKLQLLENGIQIIDIPRKQGGGSKWVRVLHATKREKDMSIISSVKEIWNKFHEQHVSMHTDHLENIKMRIQHVITSLNQIIAEPALLRLPLELSSRQFADVAFTLALCGIDDPEVYRLLVQGMTMELKRIGSRKSFHVAELLRIANRFACAGVLDVDFSQFVVSLLSSKSITLDVADSLQILHKSCFSLHSLHAKNMLWKYVSKLHKYGRQIAPIEESSMESEISTQIQESPDAPNPAHKKPRLSDHSSPIDISMLFSDCSKPLVLDLGCGFGVSLLCLASYDDEQQYNYLGGDASPEGVSYAASISKRWNMPHCQFIVADVLPLLRHVISAYRGEVAWIIVNFPTPYVSSLIPRYHPTVTLKTPEEDKQHNSQLPTEQDHFMITEELFALCGEAFLRNVMFVGNLLLQSNVEDVAIAIRNMIERMKPNYRRWFEVPRSLIDGIASADKGETLSVEYTAFCEKQLGVFYDSSTLENKITTLQWASLSGREACTQRQHLWIQSSGTRAEGIGWLSDTPLPHGAMSETEAMYKLSVKDVHRLWMTYSNLNE